MRLINRGWLGLALAFMVFGFANPTSTSKTPNPNPGDPFATKRQKHQATATVVQKRLAFESEIKNLGQKIAAIRSQTSLPPVSQKPAAQAGSLSRLYELSGRALKIAWNDDHSLPIFIQGKRLQEKTLVGGSVASDVTLSQQAISFLAENTQLLKIQKPADELKLIGVQRDAYGLTHLRYQQIYAGLEIWGADIYVHLNTAGNVEAFNGRYQSTPSAIASATQNISEAQARRIAQQDLRGTADQTTTQKLIYVDDNKQPHLAWLVQTRIGLGQNWHHFIDAQTGRTLERYNDVQFDGPATGSGTDLLNQTRNLNVYQIGSDYYLIDAAKPMFKPTESTFPDDAKGVVYTFDARNGDGGTLYYVTTNNSNSWNNQSAVSAAANGALVYDYYSEVHQRNAIDGNGSTMNLAVNYKQNYNNAFWNGQFMVFGNGDGQSFSDLAGALDVTAHEMSHGVIEHTANLIYEKQSGALNESFADVFGVLFEFWVEGDNGDWLIGEDVTTPGTNGDALRDMADPASSKAAFGGQPTKMSEYEDLPNTDDGDHGGVHSNSGIPNRAFYLFTTTVGRTDAERVYYQALSNYLTRNSQFIDCRLAVIKAAEDIFGAGSAQATAAGQAFDTVEILDGAVTPPPPVQPPVVGNEYLVVIDATSGLLYRSSVDAQEIVQISSSAVATRPTVTDEGDYIFYVDETDNVHLLNSDGSNDQPLSTSGGFNNLAISPNGRYLAATSIFEEANIYIVDLQDPNGVFTPIPLYTPTYTQGQTSGNILYPDRIDWASDSELLMYDAFNIYVDTNGDTTGYWDINLLHTSDGSISRLLPPQPPGINIGNAVFASNTDNLLAFDFVDETGNVTVKTLDLNTGETGLVTDNFQSLGSPSFSRDDQRIYYHYISTANTAVWYVDLQGLDGDGNDQQLLTDAVFPVDFTVGERPTGVENKDQTIPQEFALAQNYPNPFNPTTAISYSLPSPARVKLTVIDFLGRVVTTLVDAQKNAGEEHATWNGRDADGNSVASGIYFFHMQATSPTGQTTTLTRKMTLLK